jgi:predicted  nucleic acid-binding Zn-ribbon protein
MINIQNQHKMKRIVLVLLCVGLFVQVIGQTKVRGTYKGKSIKIDYYSGEPPEILSLEYELVNDLNKEITTLKATKTKLETDVKNLQDENKRLKTASPTTETGKDNALSQELLRKEQELKNKEQKLNQTEKELIGKEQTLTKQQQELAKKEQELKNKDAELSRREQNLGNQQQQVTSHSNTMDSLERLIAKNNSDIAAQQVKIAELDQAILHLEGEKEKLNLKIDSVMRENENLTRIINNLPSNVYYYGSLSLSAGIGFPFLTSDLIANDFWEKKFSPSVQAYLSYETPQLAPKAPISLSVGVGVRYFKLSRNFKNLDETINDLTDKDVDMYNLLSSYNNISENVSLTYLDIPLAVCFGKPNVHKVSAWGKIGITPSFTVGKKFSGDGTYTYSGYYPEWDVELYDIEELDFVTNAKSYENAEYSVNPFVIWANVSGGIFIPFSNVEKKKVSPWVLKFGAVFNYSITKISKTIENPDKADASYHIKNSNILGGSNTRLLSIGLEVGLIYVFMNNKK